MPEFTVWITNHQYAVCHIEAESEEDAMAKAKEMWDNRQLDYYEEKVGSIQADED